LPHLDIGTSQARRSEIADKRPMALEKERDELKKKIRKIEMRTEA
jgi:hypothetical protein